MSFDKIDQFQPVPDIELLVYVVDMIPDRAAGNEQLSLDIFIARPSENQTDNLLLSWSECVLGKDVFQALLISQMEGFVFLPQPQPGDNKGGCDYRQDDCKPCGPPERRDNFNMYG